MNLFVGLPVATLIGFCEYNYWIPRLDWDRQEVDNCLERGDYRSWIDIRIEGECDCRTVTLIVRLEYNLYPYLSSMC